MKKFLLKTVGVLLSMSLLFSQTVSIYARSASPDSPELEESAFSYDEDEMSEALSELNELDAYLEMNVDQTYASLAESGNPLIADIESTASPMGMAGQDGEPPLGIPSFLWGCVFGIIGLLIVFVATDSDKDETRKAMWGCVASTVVSGVIYGLAYSLYLY